jgi:hypothetical protein
VLRFWELGALRARKSPECLGAAPNTDVPPSLQASLTALLFVLYLSFAAGRAVLSSLAGSVLLAQPALAEEDAVDSAVANLTEAVKVGCSCVGTLSQQESSSKHP